MKVKDLVDLLLKQDQELKVFVDDKNYEGLVKVSIVKEIGIIHGTRKSYGIDPKDKSIDELGIFLR